MSIETIDNPGWCVMIDLVGTSLENVLVEPFKKDCGEKNWISCEIHDNQFVGYGDPHKLQSILDYFIRLIEI